MKVALISDTHFGWKNDSLLFQDSFKRFYDEVFFPELRKRGITTVIHLGDLFDRRKYINFHILYRTRYDFLEKLADSGYDVHFIVGNHDTYFRDSNDVNSITELIQMRWEKFHVYEEPQEVTFDGLRVLFVPWLNPTNTPAGLDMIARSKASVLMGHLELKGFHMDRTQVCEQGMDPNLFGKFDLVLSGHFHHASREGTIWYLGAPYELTFADHEDPKGFYIFDTETMAFEIVQNPYRMFYKLNYDDRDQSKHGELAATDFAEYADKFVQVNVLYKTNPILYEQWIDKLMHVNPADLQINERYSLEVSEEAEEGLLEEYIQVIEGGEPTSSSTIILISAYIDKIEMDINKDRLKDMMKDLYTEAVTIGGIVNA